MQDESDRLSAAAPDYLWLLDRGYPEGPTLQLVGNRYRLTRAGRAILQRGIAPTRQARHRLRLLSTDPTGKRIMVDGHNVLLTAANYLAGRGLCIGNDGLLRDDGALHGRIHNQALMKRSVELICTQLLHSAAARVDIVMDRPVSHSADHAGLFREYLLEAPFPVEVSLQDTADTAVIHATADLIVTADSGIIDAAARPVWDAAHCALQQAFAPCFIDVRDWIGPPP